MKRTKIRLKPSKLNKHLVLERIGKKRGIKFSIIFTDFGHRCAYIKPTKDNLAWLVYVLRRNCSRKYFELIEKFDYDLIPTVHGGMGFMYFNGNKDRGFTDGLVIGWDYGHCNDARDYDLVKKYFGESYYTMSSLAMFKGIPMSVYTHEDILRDIKVVIDNVFYDDEKYADLKKELQRMIFKPFTKKRKYKNK